MLPLDIVLLMPGDLEAAREEVEYGYKHYKCQQKEEDTF